jgi:hypothetical protein
MIHAPPQQAGDDLQWLLYQQIVDDLQWLSWLYRTGWGQPAVAFIVLEWAL